VFLLALFLLGAAAGLAAGLLGVGGGLVMVPCLTLLLPAAGWPQESVMQAAVATSLASILLTGSVSALSHHRRGAVAWPVGLALLPGVLIGALLGGPLGKCLGGTWLAVLFSAWLLFAAWRLARPEPLDPTGDRLPGPGGLFVPGLAIGVVSGLVGIGGGTLTVPYLVRHGVAIRRAVATSAALGVGIAAAGTASHALAALGSPLPLPPRALGYVDLPAGLVLGVTGALAAPLGADLAHRLPVPTLRRLFAGLLMLLSAGMAVQALRL
jgi:uncharacterized membrane protein YfcA